MTRKKNVSVRFLAEKTGVSIATVSRVLNQSTNVSPETRDKIINAMNEYGYRQTYTTHRSGVIGILSPNNPVDYYVSINEKLTKTLKKAGYTSIITLFDGSEEFITALQTLSEYPIDGLILIGGKYEVARPFLRPAFPKVWIDCDDAAAHLPDICNVQSDHFTGGQLAAQELIRKGCRNPIVVSGPSRSYRTFDRLNGFCSEFLKKDIVIPDDHIIRLPFHESAFEESRNAFRYLVTKGFDFDSALVISDWGALGAYVGITSSGKRVPEDYRLIGFDGISTATRSILNITCVQQDTTAIAENACDLLIRTIQSEEPKTKDIIIPVRIANGQTV